MYIIPKGIFVARLAAASVSVAKTLVQVNGASTVVVVPFEVVLTFLGTTSTSIRVRLAKRTTAGTGTSFTPIRLAGAASAASTATVDHTAEGTLGDVLFDAYVNYLAGQPLKLPIPEGRAILAPSERVSLDFPTAPGAAVTLTAEIVFAEVG